LGGGEVKLLELASAYGVFANDGVRNPYRVVLEISDSSGNILEQSTTSPSQVIDQQISRKISDILSDNKVRMNSLKPIADGVGRPVAIKTGTTNDYRDVWTVGYTPNLVVGAWAGNSDNTPMKHNVAGLIISPLWGAFMSKAVKGLPQENFESPEPTQEKAKPVLHGVWQGGISYWKDKVSGKIATEYTPTELQEEIVFSSVHSILHWVLKDDPRGAIPTDPNNDSQYENWEYGVRKWFDTYRLSHPEFKEVTTFQIPTETDDIHTPDKMPKVEILSPANGSTIDPSVPMSVQLKLTGAYPSQKTELYQNGKLVLTSTGSQLNFSFIPADVGNVSDNNTLSAIVYDSVSNKGQALVNFVVQ
jgi:membrane peptidoglycan carboxypeptidase